MPSHNKDDDQRAGDESQTGRESRHADEGDSMLRRLSKPFFVLRHREKKQEDIDLIRLALHQSPFFTCLDEEQVERFVDAAELKTYSPSEVVILEGHVDEDADEEKEKPQQPQPDLRVEPDPISPPASIDNNQASINEETNEGQPDLEPTTVQEESSRPPSMSSSIRLPTDDEQHRLVIEVDETDVEQDEEGEVYASIQTRLTRSTETDEQDDFTLTLDDVVPSTMHDIGTENEPDTCEEQPRRSPDQPRRSGQTSYVYIVRKGKADVWMVRPVHSASFGPGKCFGEGGFLFRRQHSATVQATGDDELECWVVPSHKFRKDVLPSRNRVRIFLQHATNGGR